MSNLALIAKKTILSNIVMLLMNSFGNLMKFFQIDVLILLMPVQALGIATVRAPIKENKDMEEVMLLVALVMLQIMGIQDLPMLELPDATITYHQPSMLL